MKAIIFDWTGTLYERGKSLFSFYERILKELKPKYKLALISRSVKPDKRKKAIEKSGISHYFDFIEVVSAKTKEKFLYCMNKLGVNPEETIVVDDRMSRAIKPGNDLGCETVWIQKGDRSFDAPTKDTGEPNHKIDSIQELKNII